MLRFSLAFALLAAPVILPATQDILSAPTRGFQQESHQTKAINETLLRRLIEECKWSALSHAVKSGIQKHNITLRDLQMLALSHPGTPFFNAVLATKNIMSLPVQTGLSLTVAFPIALFAETSMISEVEKGKHFWDSHRFGRELQYDRDHKHLFIHLGTHGVKPVGIGRMKVVTKTILYDRQNPEVMARGVSEAGCKREMYAMKKLVGLPHVLEAQALMRHKDPKSGKMLASIVTRIIRPGSLYNVLEKNSSWKLTLKERVKIACDIMKGISGMQEMNFAHCDLGVKNYFVKIRGTHPGHRKIVAYVADFGRTIPIKTAKDSPVQGNSRYMPPEAIYREKMHGKQYFNSDLFAVGCVFWQLYFGDLPPWSDSEYFKKESVPKKHRYRAKVYYINIFRHRIQEKYLSGIKKKPTLKQGFLKIILQLTDPSPAKRGTAQKHHIALHRLLYGKSPVDSAREAASRNKKNGAQGAGHHSDKRTKKCLETEAN